MYSYITKEVEQHNRKYYILGAIAELCSNLVRKHNLGILLAINDKQLLSIFRSCDLIHKMQVCDKIFIYMLGLLKSTFE